MKPLNPNQYEAVFAECDILHLPVFNQRSGLVKEHRCLNYTLRITSAGSDTPIILVGGIPLDITQGRYAPIIQFFRQIGWFRDPEAFDAEELLNHRVRVDTNILFDKKLGFVPHVIRFYPA